ncbi:DUF2313 domain-containing protein [Pseudomonas juntendi]|uniref:DUF2313 domain-containing protein n=1 Tax=Pseudomonas juntendi TaxID=2666183 RepID=A0A7W2QBN0_9PSED|nr:putative phage tail protein [Pseudomonas juntendi]MBA6100452.1 DUF2313 domain-containing protein [Pseudomonas juntendi]
MSDILVEQLQSLLPPVAYNAQGKVLVAQLTAEANALGAAVEALEAVQSAIFPQSAGDFIVDWERVYGLQPPLTATYVQRVNAVIAAMSDLGGQSIPYFERLASLFGVTANVEVFRVPVVGLMNTGDPVYAGDWPYIWRVNSPLSAYTTSSMENRLTERRPANTEVVFGYGVEVVSKLSSAADELFGAVHYAPFPLVSQYHE